MDSFPEVFGQREVFGKIADKGIDGRCCGNRVHGNGFGAFPGCRDLIIFDVLPFELGTVEIVDGYVVDDIEVPLGGKGCGCKEKAAGGQ